MGAILSNITRKLLWFEITKMLITHTHPFVRDFLGAPVAELTFIHPLTPVLIIRQLPELIPTSSNSGLDSCISISIHIQHVT